MSDSRRTGATESGRPHRSGPRGRGRLVTVAAFAAVVAGGVGLAAACGEGQSDRSTPPGAQRATAGARPSEHPGHHSPHGRANRSTRPSSSPSDRRGWDRRPDSVAAVGDSITRGFDACSLLADCTRVSWVTGTSPGVRSLAARLTGGHPSGRSWNHAATGAVMADLPHQMARAARHRPKLVTVMSGANDACRPTADRMTPTAAFRSEFRTALHTLRKRSPSSEVYVSSVPDLRRLWSQGRGVPMAKRVWGLGICQSMLRAPESSNGTAEDRRQQVYEQVVAYNEVLRSECDRIARCRFDGGAVFRYRFTHGQMSHLDWFHPSRAGQRELARLAYEGITAASPHRPR